MLMHTLAEDFLFSLRHERGQAEHTQKTYQGLLDKFVAWAGTRGLTSWRDVRLAHLTEFLQHERDRRLADAPEESTAKLSTSSLYLQIAALRAFFKWAETEKHLPANPAENLSLPRRWKRIPKSLTKAEIEQILKPLATTEPADLCDQAVLELAYASGLRLAELRNLRLEQLHLEAGFVNVIGKGNKERVVSVGMFAVAALGRYLTVARPHAARHGLRSCHDVAAYPPARAARGRRAARHAAHAAAQLRHAPAGARRGPARDPGAARPFQHQHDGDLHPRGGGAPARGPRAASPAREVSAPPVSRVDGSRLVSKMARLSPHT
jgi:site-specific recombinase XerD